MQYFVQILISILLIITIILQAKGVGLGSAFGGSGTYHSKRGVEKSLFYLTIVFAIVFVAISAYNAL